MKCTSCGNELKEGAKYCPLCGHPAGQEEAPARMHPPEKDPVTIIKSPESGKPSRKGPLLAAAAAAILLLLLILPRFLKGDPRARLE